MQIEQSDGLGIAKLEMMARIGDRDNWKRLYNLTHRKPEERDDLEDGNRFRQWRWSQTFFIGPRAQRRRNS